MKILFVKSNNIRNKAYQLRTIVYKEDNQRFVKKEAICCEAIPHLKKMKNSYTNLSATIVNKNIKLAKIVGETYDSLTFEYIDGVSMADKFYQACEEGQDSIDQFIDKYLKLLSTGFKTCCLKTKKINRPEYEKYFGESSVESFDDQLSLESFSNIDLIFSNIILRGNEIYLIDYEWVINLAVPISYIAYRSVFYSLHDRNIIGNFQSIMDYSVIDDYFIEQVVMRESFFFGKRNYVKRRYSLEEAIELKEQRMQLSIDELTTKIIKKNDSIRYWKNVAESRRIKSRIKRIIKKLVQ